MILYGKGLRRLGEPNFKIYTAHLISDNGEWGKNLHAVCKLGRDK